MPSAYEKLFPDSQSITDEAYHGTDDVSAETILKEGFKPSHGERQYLGDGVYFFERQPSEAITWARSKSSSSGWAVLKSKIRYGKCLNLHEKQHSDLLTKLVSGIRRRRDDQISEAVAIKALAQYVQIDTVLGINQKHWGAPWLGARFEGGVQLILCVRNLSNIIQTTRHYTAP